jgi:hypothetical protein
MLKIFIFLIIAIIAVVLIEFLRGGRQAEDKKWSYQYKRKSFLMSRAEHECYDALMLAVGKDYYVFPQVHLPTIVDSKVVGQNWRGAFRHINEKSVDFVLCDKAYIAPKLVIELDDRSHERTDRKERDVEVERILAGANLPLLRLENHGAFKPEELAEKVKAIVLIS